MRALLPRPEGGQLYLYFLSTSDSSDWPLTSWESRLGGKPGRKSSAGAMGLPVLLWVSCLVAANALDVKDVVFVILSHSNQYHRSLAEKLRQDIINQAKTLNQGAPPVHFSHEDFPHVGGWAVLPLVPPLVRRHAGNCSWFFFAEDRTGVDLGRLVEVLEKYDGDEEIWLGYGLRDREPTIIHHFAFFEDPGRLLYPNALSGFAVSNRLMQRLRSRWENRDVSASDFSIDHAYELALFIWNNNDGPALQHELAFCASRSAGCASFPLPFESCGSAASGGSIYFAVKTCQKFHEERVRVVQRTWGQHAPLLRFFSDVEDASIPTISLGIPNTERGHCEKTTAIMKYAAEDIKGRPEVEWVVLADDDTILSVGRLEELLSCYDPSTPVALGERYGYNIYNKQGYNYITGGGGIVFSKTLLQELIIPEACKCPSISSPDDMFLGVCIARHGVDITHSSFFHQARPMDYAPEYLQSQHVVSFHKHWMVDPFSVYKKWFADADLRVSRTPPHEEL